MGTLRHCDTSHGNTIASSLCLLIPSTILLPQRTLFKHHEFSRFPVSCIYCFLSLECPNLSIQSKCPIVLAAFLSQISLSVPLLYHFLLSSWHHNCLCMCHICLASSNSSWALEAKKCVQEQLVFSQSLAQLLADRRHSTNTWKINQQTHWIDVCVWENQRGFWSCQQFLLTFYTSLNFNREITDDKIITFFFKRRHFTYTVSFSTYNSFMK